MVSGIAIHCYVYVYNWITIAHNYYVVAIFYTPLQVVSLLILGWLLAASQASESLPPHNTALIALDAQNQNQNQDMTGSDTRKMVKHQNELHCSSIANEASPVIQEVRDIGPSFLRLCRLLVRICQLKVN